MTRWMVLRLCLLGSVGAGCGGDPVIGAAEDEHREKNIDWQVWDEPVDLELDGVAR